jgi:uncharacterized protein (DUF362 family)
MKELNLVERQQRRRNGICIDRVTPVPESVAAALDTQLAWLGNEPRPGDVWAVKLNLTYPTYLPGVVNSPIFVEGLCQWASDRRVRLQLVEGDGGTGSYSALDAFSFNGLTPIAERYGVQLVTVSEKPWQWRETSVDHKVVRLPYSPFFARHEYDRFITAPLFKNHIFTVATLGMKNLWGCIPDPYRMYYHHVLDHGIVALTKELRPDFSIFDGIIALRGRGPMDGFPVEMNAVMCAENVGAGEVAALRIMNIDLKRVRHLSIALREGLIPESADLSWRDDPREFERHDFQMQRTLLNYGSIMVGKFPRLQRLVYHSSASRAVYAVVDRMRPGSAQTRLLEAKRARLYSPIPFDQR